MAESASGPLHKTPLHAAHVSLGARMVPFAGYDMPVQYPAGVLTEHNWTRSSAGLFDVSHMGQAFLIAPDHAAAARALEALCAADILNLKPGQQRYSQLLNEAGGILDDFMVTRSADPKQDGRLYLVVNAGCKDQDYAHIQARLPAGVRLETLPAQGLIAIQGPKAAELIEALSPGAAAMGFMTARRAVLGGIGCHISRSGYTGEDGFEISVSESRAVELWALLLEDQRVRPIGLGARDSLRLEAGLCLYGHDIDATTSPVEAGLVWSMQKRRREAGGFPGAGRIQRELREGAQRLRVGIKPDGRQPAREGTLIFKDGKQIGVITSGGFGPSVNGPVAMGYAEAACAVPGTPLTLQVRGKELGASVVPLPFIANRYVRKP